MARPGRHRQEPAHRRGAGRGGRPFYRSWLTGFSERVTRTADDGGLGDPDRRAGLAPKARREIELSNGLVARVTEAELLEAAALANRHGLAICPNSAVALAAAGKLRREGAIGRDESVVVVATAHAIKFSGAAVRYHGAALASNPPRSLPASLEAVAAALENR